MRGAGCGAKGIAEKGAGRSAEDGKKGGAGGFARLVKEVHKLVH
jgi:hypothetical protein